ncbi:hypothetical protein HD554DRAFT_372794 [Boletus coccyginus]|nr:hypothetical protein HD554DRAFT_372794 [Boletus coccyginus]
MSDNPFLVLDGPICGSLYFASVMSSGFYGVTCMQTFFYYVHYRNDPLRMKSFVAALWAFNTIHEALIIAGVYKYIMAGLANPASILNGIPELLLVFTGLVAVPTQGFFVYRIYIFNGRNIFGPLIWVPLAIYQLVSTILYVTKGLYIADSSVHAVGLQVLNEPFFKDLASSSLSVAVTVDVLIAVVLMFLLVRKRAETGFSSTAHVLQRLTVFVVNAGIWTATFAILSLLFVRRF